MVYSCCSQVVRFRNWDQQIDPRLPSSNIPCTLNLINSVPHGNSSRVAFIGTYPQKCAVCFKCGDNSSCCSSCWIWYTCIYTLPEWDVVFLVGKCDNSLAVLLWHWKQILQNILNLKQWQSTYCHTLYTLNISHLFHWVMAHAQWGL